MRGGNGGGAFADERFAQQGEGPSFFDITHTARTHEEGIDFNAAGERLGIGGLVLASAAVYTHNTTSTTLRGPGTEVGFMAC